MRIKYIGALIWILMIEFPVAAAEGKLSDWGPFKFGQTAEQLKSLFDSSAPVTPDSNDTEISSLQISSVKFEYATGSANVQFYNNRAFEFSFFTLNAVDAFVPQAQANTGFEAKIKIWCPNVFAHALDVFAGSYGKPDEILRPELAAQLDPTVQKASSARWWFSDGSRLLVLSAEKASPPYLCTEFIDMRSAKYSKPYVPEMLSHPK